MIAHFSKTITMISPGETEMSFSAGVHRPLALVPNWHAPQAFQLEDRATRLILPRSAWFDGLARERFRIIVSTYPLKEFFVLRMPQIPGRVQYGRVPPMPSQYSRGQAQAPPVHIGYIQFMHACRKDTNGRGLCRHATMLRDKLVGSLHRYGAVWVGFMLRFGPCIAASGQKTPFLENPRPKRQNLH